MGDIRSSNSSECGNVENHVENSKTTLPRIYWPLMNAPTMIAGRCFICGRHEPLDEHHIVWRSWGQLVRDGRCLPKPTITLCGFGNNLQDANGRMYCHGLAHHRMLHFRWHEPTDRSTSTTKQTAWGGGYLEYLLTSKPTKYEDALRMDGWKKVSLLREEGL